MNDLERLYRDHYAEVFKFALQRVGHRQAAEDIAHDVFARAAGRMDDWEERGKPRVAWLITIADNLIKDLWKSATFRRESAVEDLRDFGRSHDPIGDWFEEEEEQALARIRSHALRMAILRLPSEREREAMLWRHIDGLSVEETAERMGISPPMVKMATYRATRALERALRPRAAALGFEPSEAA
jgi:RNA polymerase sigma-70 factor, ECF subfamily